MFTRPSSVLPIDCVRPLDQREGWRRRSLCRQSIASAPSTSEKVGAGGHFVANRLRPPPRPARRLAPAVTLSPIDCVRPLDQREGWRRRSLCRQSIASAPSTSEKVGAGGHFVANRLRPPPRPARRLAPAVTLSPID